MALAQAAPAAVSAAAWRVGGGVEPVWATVARAAAVPNQGRRPRGGVCGPGVAAARAVAVSGAAAWVTPGDGCKG